MAYNNARMIGLLVLLLACGLGSGLPMANEEELVALDSVEQVQSPEMQHILKISPKHEPDSELVLNQNGPYDTIVQQLKAAGVQTSGQQPLNTLTYKELSRLLALWHMAQGRTYYEAGEKPAYSAAAAAATAAHP